MTERSTILPTAGTAPLALALTLGLALVPAGRAAAEYDDSAPLICASIDAVDCSLKDDGHCRSGDADDVSMPDFVRVDFERKELTVLDDERRGEVTEVQRYEDIDGKMILQGIESGRGWTLLISKTTGNTVMTVSDELGAFVIFGECTRP